MIQIEKTFYVDAYPRQFVTVPALSEGVLVILENRAVVLEAETKFTGFNSTQYGVVFYAVDAAVPTVATAAASISRRLRPMELTTDRPWSVGSIPAVVLTNPTDYDARVEIIYARGSDTIFTVPGHRDALRVRLSHSPAGNFASIDVENIYVEANMPAEFSASAILVPSRDALESLASSGQRSINLGADVERLSVFAWNCASATKLHWGDGSIVQQSIWLTTDNEAAEQSEEYLLLASAGTFAGAAAALSKEGDELATLTPIICSGLAVDTEDSVAYSVDATDPIAPRIKVRDLELAETGELALTLPVEAGYGLTFIGGKLWFCDFDSGEIRRVDATTGALEASFFPGASFDLASGVVAGISSDGTNLWICALTNGFISGIVGKMDSANGDDLFQFGLTEPDLGLLFPQSLVYDRTDDTIWVLAAPASVDAYVFHYATDGTLLSYFRAEAFDVATSDGNAGIALAPGSVPAVGEVPISSEGGGVFSGTASYFYLEGELDEDFRKWKGLPPAILGTLTS